MDTKQIIETTGLATLSGFIVEAEKVMPSEQVKLLVVFAYKFGKNHEYVQDALTDAPKPETYKDWVEDPKDWTV